jgi:cytochrome c peroxidase
MVTISEALASYMRTLISGNSPFDQWLYGHQDGAMTAQALRGYKLFIGKAGCVQCHTIGPQASLFTDNQFHNTGLGWQQSMGASTGYRQVPIAPGLTVELSDKVIDSVTGVRHHDDGRYAVTLDPADRWKYKTPSLRNVALTAPYMHNGSLPTLEEVVKFYNQGGVPNPVLDPLIHPLSLSQPEEDDLVAFLKSLTGSNVRELISETREQPVSKFAPSESYN